MALLKENTEDAGRIVQGSPRSSAPSLAEMILIGVLLLFFALSLLHFPAQMVGTS